MNAAQRFRDGLHQPSAARRIVPHIPCKRSERGEGKSGLYSRGCPLDPCRWSCPPPGQMSADASGGGGGEIGTLGQGAEWLPPFPFFGGAPRLKARSGPAGRGGSRGVPLISLQVRVSVPHGRPVRWPAPGVRGSGALQRWPRGRPQRGAQLEERLLMGGGWVTHARSRVHARGRLRRTHPQAFWRPSSGRRPPPVCPAEPARSPAYACVRPRSARVCTAKVVSERLGHASVAFTMDVLRRPRYRTCRRRAASP